MTYHSHQHTTYHEEERKTDLLIGPSITLYTDRLDRQQRSESLRDLIVQSSGSDLLDEDRIGVLTDLYLRGGHFSENPDRETRSREGVSTDEVGGNVEQSTEGSYFVCRRRKSGNGIEIKLMRANP